MIRVKLNPGDYCRADATGELGSVVESKDSGYLVEFADGVQEMGPCDLSLDGLNPYYVTYGLGGNLGRNYSVVWATCYTEARDQIDEITAGKFAFCYSAPQFKGQAEKYGLTEVPLQGQILDSADL